MGAWFRFERPSMGRTSATQRSLHGPLNNVHAADTWCTCIARAARGAGTPGSPSNPFEASAPGATSG